MPNAGGDPQAGQGKRLYAPMPPPEKPGKVALSYRSWDKPSYFPTGAVMFDQYHYWMGIGFGRLRRYRSISGKVMAVARHMEWLQDDEGAIEFYV